MNKTIKRILSLLLCVVMVFTIAPLSGIFLEAEAATYKTGDIISFGSYPQSEVTDSSLKSKLNSLSKTWISYGYYSGTGDWGDGKMKPGDFMKYADVTYNGVKYRGVNFTQYRPCCTGFTSSASNSYQDDRGYYTNTTYWFKYEPLKWGVLEPNTGLVLCESIIDSQAYNNTVYCYRSEDYQTTSCTTYANDYAKSSIREWLNDDFYNTAFTSTQKSQIVTSTLDNSGDNSKYDSATTKDKVFMLSYWDVSNISYGFLNFTREAKATAYAKCQGIYSYSGNSYWWLRTPGYNSHYVCSVYSSGDVCYNYYNGVDYYSGVRPALKLNLNSLNDKDLSKSTTTLSSLANTCNGPQLKWSKVDGASGYYVYRKTSGNSFARIGTTTSTSYIDKTAKSGTTYIYTAKAYNSSSVSNYQSGLTIKYLTAPTVKVANSKSGAQVSWGAITGASGYTVWRKTGSDGTWAQIGTTSSTTFTDTTAKNGTTYYYNAKATSGSYTSSWRAGVALKYVTAPKISSITNSVDGPYMTWNKISNATGYYVYRKTGSNGTWTQIGKTTSTAYKDKTAKSGTTYYYNVKAYNGSTVSSWYSGTPIKFLTAPTISSLQNSVDGPYMKWNKVTGASGYYVYRRTGSGEWSQIDTTTDTSYRDKTAKSGTTYYYSIKSYSGSTTSSMRAGTPLKFLSAPTISSVSSISNGLKVSWGAVTGATQYQVWRRVAGGEWYLQGTTTSTSFTDNEVKVGSTFYYSIKAVNGNTTSSMRGGVAGTRK